MCTQLSNSDLPSVKFCIGREVNNKANILRQRSWFWLGWRGGVKHVSWLRQRQPDDVASTRRHHGDVVTGTITVAPQCLTGNGRYFYRRGCLSLWRFVHFNERVFIRIMYILYYTILWNLNVYLNPYHNKLRSLELINNSTVV